MISALTGILLQVDEGRIHVQVGPILYEMLIPSADVEQLRSQRDEELTFHTIFYLEGDARGGNLSPRLIGFQRPQDKEFFNIFTTVKGIGPKTALRALSVPIAEIAHAIENKDTRFLVQLDGIGKRTAELIVAELAGKVKQFVLATTLSTAGHRTGRPPIEEDAIAAMMSLDERLRRPDAEHLLERAKQTDPALKTTDGLLREMLRLRTIRS